MKTLQSGEDKLKPSGGAIYDAVLKGVISTAIYYCHHRVSLHMVSLKDSVSSNVSASGGWRGGLSTGTRTRTGLVRGHRTMNHQTRYGPTLAKYTGLSTRRTLIDLKWSALITTVIHIKELMLRCTSRK